MALLTLGRLDFAGQSSPQPQALLLLAFLSIEGRKERGFLGSLFWPEAKRPLNNLSSALSRLRAIDTDCINADRHVVEANVATDVSRFARHAGAGEHAEALALYGGRFLDGFDVERLGFELQEWILDQRASLAAAARDCATASAELAYQQGSIEQASTLAEKAVQLAADAVPDRRTLAVLHPILRAGNSPSAELVRSQSVDLGLDLAGPTPPATPADSSHRQTTTTDGAFFGRESEIADVTQALARDRIVAVLGLGGVGKSVLARRVAEATTATPNEICWLDCSAVGAVELLPELLSSHLWPEEPPAPDMAGLGSAIGNRPLLVVLDGTDELTADDGIVSLRDLVDVCPRLRLLLTSRNAIDESNTMEHSVRLDGLPVLESGVGPGPAVQLFAACFARITPSGDRLAPNDPAAIEICQRLDGHPLAIQLAAGWLNVLTPEEIAANLSGPSADGVDLLDSSVGGGNRDEHELEGFGSVMDSTWRLLDRGARDALARLSVLSGGFDRHVAEVVASCDLVALRRLAAWSLVGRRDGHWYRCHPLVRSYAQRRLAEDPELHAAALDAHAALVLDAVRDAPNVDSFDSGTVLDGVEEPLANVLTVFADLVARGRFESVAELADPLDRLLGFHGRLLTLQDTLQMAVLALADQTGGNEASAWKVDDAEEVRDRLEMHLVWLHLRLGRYQEAAETADRLLAGANTAPDVVVELTRARSAIDRTEGQVDQALQRLIATRDLAATVSERLKAMVDDDIGLCQMVLGLYPESRESYRAVLAWARRTGSQPMIARTLLSLGIGHHDGGEILDSLAYLVEAKSVATVNGLRHIEPYVDVKLARTYLHDGDIDAAAQVIDGALARSGAEWEPWLTAEFDLVSARLAAARDDPETMWARLERSLGTSADLDDLPFVAKSLVALVDLGSARPEVGPQAEGGVPLLAGVAETDSGADYADRLEAEHLLERLGASPPEGPKPLVDLIDEGFGYLRRGRLLTSRANRDR